MNARPRKPRFLRKVRDIVQAGGGANGVTNFGDIRLLKRLIYAIGSGLPAARLWAGRGPDGFFRHVTSNKKAGISADLVCWRSRNNARSVSRCDRCAVTAEAIVDAQGDHIHVLGDPIVENSGGTQIDTRERIIGIAHEQVVVFNTKRPVRCEAVLKSDAHGAAPAGRAGRGQFNAGKRFEDAKAVARHRRTALYVEQRLHSRRSRSGR